MTSLGPVLQRLLADDVHVDPERLRVDAVRRHLVEPATEVDLHAVRQVAAVRELEAEDAVALPDERVHRGRVGLGAGVRLDVRVGRAVQRLGPLAGEVLGDVDVLAAAVVPLARVALGVLVRQHAPLGGQDGARGEVLARDHLERAALTGDLLREHGGELRVDVLERGVRHLGRRRRRGDVRERGGVGHPGDLLDGCGAGDVRSAARSRVDVTPGAPAGDPRTMTSPLAGGDPPDAGRGRPRLPMPMRPSRIVGGSST